MYKKLLVVALGSMTLMACDAKDPQPKQDTQVEAQAELQQKAADLQESARDLLNTASEKAGELGDSAKAAASDMSDKTAEQVNEAADKISAAVASGADQVRKATSPECAESHHSLPGGWSKGEITPEVIDAANAAVKSLGADQKLKQVDSVSQQVVAGLNYYVKFTTEDGKEYAAKVFRSLKGEYDVKEVKLAEETEHHCGSHHE
ncbi:cystatin domain-containing protein [Photobacterium damselae]|uniref:cystatin domain-containing protein n=1 Tax=Photobacterium damselae TaxID=38293 RepID=UPI00370B7721